MESSWNQGTLATDRLAGNGRSAVTVLRVQGEHDLATAPSVRAALAEAGDGEALIVDLRDCTFVDSSIIAALLHARQERTAFAVVLPADPASAVVRAFTIAGLSTHLPCSATLDDARRLVDEPPA